MEFWKNDEFRQAIDFYPKKISQPYAWIGHTPFLAFLIEKIKPKTFVELGVHTGNSYFTACQTVKKSMLATRCFGIDTWEGDEHAGLYENSVFDEVNDYNESNYSNFSKLLRNKFDDALGYFENASIDLLHIDGMHTYEAVRHDYESWLPKLAPGSIVLFHDISEKGSNFGVWRLWDELSEAHPHHFSFDHSYGLGVLQIHPNNSCYNINFIFESTDDAIPIKIFFESLGLRISSKLYTEDFRLKELNYHLQLRDYHNLCIKNTQENIEKNIRHDDEIKSLNERLTKNQNALTDYHHALTDKEKILRQLFNSKSWFITKPLRGISMVARKIYAIVNSYLLRLKIIFLRLIEIKKKLKRIYLKLGLIGSLRKIREKISSYSNASIPKIDNYGDRDFLEKFLAITPQYYPAVKDDLNLTILIPVYAGIEETACCIQSVLNSKNLNQYKLMIINDCSPIDGMDILLKNFKINYSNIEILKNECNLGFVGTVNRAFALIGKSDIILLNSDTKVANNWIDKLVFHAYSSEKIGTVTPFSNNATICSYPDINGWATIPQGETVESIDEALFKANAGASIDIPTAVGFCMYIKGSVIDSCGIFDFETFGKGYGEENDFCLRAQKLFGWKHLLATDTFVYHKGEMSFGATAEERKKNALIKLSQRYPNYEKLVHDHIQKNEALIPRIRGTVSRFSAASKRSILFVIHNYDGGTEKHAKELAAYLKIHNQELSIIYMRPGSTSVPYSAIFESSDELDGFKVEFNCSSLEEMVELARKFNFTKIHIHHTIGYQFPVNAFIKKIKVPYDYTIHDYYTICPRVNLLHPLDGLCNNPSLNKCNSCLRIEPALNAEIEITEWRLRYEFLLNGASRVYCPSADTETRIKGYFPQAKTVVVPHDEVLDKRPALHRRIRKSDEKVKIVILGVLSLHKGANVVRRLIKEIKEHKLPIEIVLIGYSQEVIESHGVFKETGQYSDESLIKAIEIQNPDLILFTSIWPETYSYTLSAALKTDIKIVAPNIGAFKERLEYDFNSILYEVGIESRELLKICYE